MISTKKITRGRLKQHESRRSYFDREGNLIGCLLTTIVSPSGVSKSSHQFRSPREGEILTYLETENGKVVKRKKVKVDKKHIIDYVNSQDRSK